MSPHNVLILPGWLNSGPEHWQSRWERDYGYTRVEQHDWQRPLRGDWIARLEDVLLSCTEPAVLVAHSLGCLTVAAWAAHSKNTYLVKAALLVAPPDTDREDIAQMLPGWVLPLKSCRSKPWCLRQATTRFAHILERGSSLQPGARLSRL